MSWDGIFHTDETPGTTLKFLNLVLINELIYQNSCFVKFSYNDINISGRWIVSYSTLEFNFTSPNNYATLPIKWNETVLERQHFFARNVEIKNFCCAVDFCLEIWACLEFYIRNFNNTYVSHNFNIHTTTTSDSNRLISILCSYKLPDVEFMSKTL